MFAALTEFSICSGVRGPGMATTLCEIPSMQARPISAECLPRRVATPSMIRWRASHCSAGEEPGSEWGVRHECRSECREGARLRCSPRLCKGELVLDRAYGDRPADIGGAVDHGAGKSERADLARPDEFGGEMCDLLVRRVRVGAVLEEEVEPLTAQSSQRGVHRGAYRLGPAVATQFASIRGQPELRDDEDVVVPRERLAQQAPSA